MQRSSAALRSVVAKGEDATAVKLQFQNTCEAACLADDLQSIQDIIAALNMIRELRPTRWWDMARALERMITQQPADQLLPRATAIFLLYRQLNTHTPLVAKAVMQHLRNDPNSLSDCGLDLSAQAELFRGVAISMTLTPEDVEIFMASFEDREEEELTVNAVEVVLKGLRCTRVRGHPAIPALLTALSRRPIPDRFTSYYNKKRSAVAVASCVILLKDCGYQGSKPSPLPLAHWMVDWAATAAEPGGGHIASTQLMTNVAMAAVSVLGYKHVRLMQEVVRRLLTTSPKSFKMYQFHELAVALAVLEQARTLASYNKYAGSIVKQRRRAANGGSSSNSEDSGDDGPQVELRTRRDFHVKASIKEAGLRLPIEREDLVKAVQRVLDAIIVRIDNADFSVMVPRALPAQAASEDASAEASAAQGGSDSEGPRPSTGDAVTVEAVTMMLYNVVKFVRWPISLEPLGLELLRVADALLTLAHDTLRRADRGVTVSQLQTLLWAHASLVDAFDICVDTCEELSERLAPQTALLKPKELSHVFWSLERLKVKHSALVRGLVGTVRRDLARFEPEGLVHIAHALAHLQVQDAALMELIAGSMQERLRAGSVVGCNEAIRLVSAFAEYKQYPAALLRQLLFVMVDSQRQRLFGRSYRNDSNLPLKPQGPELNPEVTSVLAWSFAEFYIHCPSSRSDIRDHIPNVLSIIENMLQAQTAVDLKATQLERMMHFLVGTQTQSLCLIDLMDLLAAARKRDAAPIMLMRELGDQARRINAEKMQQASAAMHAAPPPAVPAPAVTAPPPLTSVSRPSPPRPQAAPARFDQKQTPRPAPDMPASTAPPPQSPAAAPSPTAAEPAQASAVEAAWGAVPEASAASEAPRAADAPPVGKKLAPNSPRVANGASRPTSAKSTVEDVKAPAGAADAVDVELAWMSGVRASPGAGWGSDAGASSQQGSPRAAAVADVPPASSPAQPSPAAAPPPSAAPTKLADGLRSAAAAVRAQAAPVHTWTAPMSTPAAKAPAADKLASVHVPTDTPKRGDVSTAAAASGAVKSPALAPPTDGVHVPGSQPTLAAPSADHPPMRHTDVSVATDREGHAGLNGSTPPGDMFDAAHRAHASDARSADAAALDASTTLEDASSEAPAATPAAPAGDDAAAGEAAPITFVFKTGPSSEEALSAVLLSLMRGHTASASSVNDWIVANPGGNPKPAAPAAASHPSPPAGVDDGPAGPGDVLWGAGARSRSATCAALSRLLAHTASARLQVNGARRPSGLQPARRAVGVAPPPEEVAQSAVAVATRPPEGQEVWHYRGSSARSAAKPAGGAGEQRLARTLASASAGAAAVPSPWAGATRLHSLGVKGLVTAARAAASPPALATPLHQSAVIHDASSRLVEEHAGRHAPPAPTLAPSDLSMLQPGGYVSAQLAEMEPVVGPAPSSDAAVTVAVGAASSIPQPSAAAPAVNQVVAPTAPVPAGEVPSALTPLVETPEQERQRKELEEWGSSYGARSARGGTKAAPRSAAPEQSPAPAPVAAAKAKRGASSRRQHMESIQWGKI